MNEEKNENRATGFNTFKGIVIGIILTLFVEMAIFVYQTCAVSVETRYIYNPSNIVDMLPEASEKVVER